VQAFDRRSKVTQTERRIKRLWLAGRTSYEIAAEIGMNERMVQGILDDLGL
jgi:DNA-binding CsgD family transcriptional regulator